MWKENVKILSYLSPKKAGNILLIHLSYYLSKWVKKPIILGLPYAINIEPTTACNLGCPECPSGLKEFSRNTGNLKLLSFKNWIDQVKNHVSYLTLYFQGEPFINPHFLDIVKYASDQKIYTATSTNAHFINKETAHQIIDSGLNRLIISIDGTTQEVYENYRVNGDLEKVIEGTKHIIAAKKERKAAFPLVIFQFLVVKPNEHQIDDIKQLGKELQVDDIWFKSAQVYDYKNGNPLIPNNIKYSRYIKTSNGEYRLKHKLENSCWKMWHSNVITWDGKVVPCCFDKDAHHQLGDLNAESFENIWKNEKYQDFRTQLLQNRSQIDICKNCSEGSKVWVKS